MTPVAALLVGTCLLLWLVMAAPVGRRTVRQRVAARVAPYKKLRQLEFIDAIPKSASGKILRRLLRDS